MEKFQKNDCVGEEYAESLAEKVVAYMAENGIQADEINISTVNGASAYISAKVFMADCLADEAYLSLKNQDGTKNIKVRISDHSSGLDNGGITSYGKMSFETFKFYVESGYIWGFGKEAIATERLKKRKEFLKQQEAEKEKESERLNKTEYKFVSSKENIEFFAQCMEYAGIKVAVKEYNGKFFASPGLGYWESNLFFAMIAKKEDILIKMKDGVKPAHIKVSNKSSLETIRLKIQ